MIHVHRSNKQFHTGFLIIVILAVISLVTSNCKSPESPDTGNGIEVATITITNDYGEALDIYLDGILQFMLANEESKDIEDIFKGSRRKNTLCL